MLWTELRVTLVKFYGLLRPPTTFPANSIHGQRPAADVHVGRVVPAFVRLELLTSLHKSLTSTANRCFHGKVAGLNEKAEATTADESAGPSRALASLNLRAQAAHFARPNFAPPCIVLNKVFHRFLRRQGHLEPSFRREFKRASLGT